MSNKILYICRGFPGSGKTSLAEALVSHKYYAEADMFFSTSGKYKFDPSLLGQAHHWCQERIKSFMEESISPIAVSNTFTTKKEIKPYIELCQKYNYSPFIIHCENDYGNVHSVPQESIDRMRARWQPWL